MFNSFETCVKGPWHGERNYGHAGSTGKINDNLICHRHGGLMKFKPASKISDCSCGTNDNI